MDFDQIRFFCHVAKLEHVSRAAEELNISQPALSSALRRLEEELGVSLFDRQGRRIHLNEYGTAFLPKAIDLLKTLEIARTELHNIKQNNDYTLNLIGPELYSYPGLMEQIYQILPDLNLRIHGRYSPSLVNAKIQTGELDLFIASRPDTISGFNSCLLRDYEMFMLVSIGHPLIGKSKLKLSDFRDALFVAKNKNYGSRFCLDTFCAQAGFVPRIAFTADNNSDIVGAVSSGSCVALLSVCAQMGTLLNLNSQVTALRLFDEVVGRQPLYLYWPDVPLVKPVIRIVKKILIDYFAICRDDPQNLIDILNTCS